MAVHDFDTADMSIDQAIAANPQAFASRGMKSALAIASKGDVEFVEKQLSLVPGDFDPDGLVTAARVGTLMLQRKFADALQLVQQFCGETLLYPDTCPRPKAFML